MADRVLLCLIVLAWSSSGRADDRFSITRDTALGSGTSTIALYCAQEGKGACSVLRSRNGRVEKRVSLARPQAPEILELGRTTLAPFSKPVGSRSHPFRWSLAYKGMDLKGALPAGRAPAEGSGLLLALMRLERRLFDELSR